MDDSEHQAMLTHDERHWWYRGRREVLRAVLDREHIPSGARLLDAGCGSGRTLDDLARRGSVSGVDVSRDAVAAARQRGHRDVRLAALEHLPFANEEFDALTCLDVLEHTADDVKCLRELRRVTRPGGLLVITVPAHPRLWSRHDVVNQHFRRYRRKDLIVRARNAGWEIDRDTYFNSLPLIPAAISRRLQKIDGDPRRSELELTPPSLDGLLTLPLRAEATVIGAGGRVWFGLSVLAVMRRPASAPGPWSTRPSRRPDRWGFVRGNDHERPPALFPRTTFAAG